MPKNDYIEVLRTLQTETRQRGDDFVLAPYENAVAELDDIIQKLDADTGESVMILLRQKILVDEHLSPRMVAQLIETVVKDLLRVKFRLETSNAQYRKKRQTAKTGGEEQT